MIELPEALTLSRQCTQAVAGRTVARVFPPTKPHKFCWFNGEPEGYEARLQGKRILSAEGFGFYVELAFEGGQRLCLNDGVNLRLLSPQNAPKDYQLLMALDDGSLLSFTVAMYGGIYLHDGAYDNEYYLKSRQALSPFSDEFPAAYEKKLALAKPSLSAKAFLATEQRFPGIGNGVLQDILFTAHVHPKRKIHSLTDGEQERLLHSTVAVLRQMTDQGGRDTEKDLFGAPGGYPTQLSKNTLLRGCPVCGGPIAKEAYLGGAVYFCPHCQPLAGR